MADPSGSTEAPVPSMERPPAAGEAAPQAAASTGIWQRIKEHKVVQWTLAYAAAAYTLLHGTEMISEAMEWPHLIARILTLVLVSGVPVVVTLAWYHGAKSLRRVSGPELTIITILLLIAGSILWALSRTSGEHAVTTTVAASSVITSATASAAPRTAIAVMPFANLTGDPGNDYVGDGMSEELINVLTKVPGLTVPSRTSSFAYKGRNTGLKQIARDLQVGTILEGSVRSAGSTIRVTAQLIDAQSDRHLWSETYDRKFADLFRLQDDLATAIVQALQVNLNGAAPASVTQAPPTRNLEAYELYMQGRTLESRGREADLRDALSMYQRAFALDPGFARAVAASANLRLTVMAVGYPLPRALADAEREASQALALDPKLAYASAALGTIKAMQGKWLDADAAFRAAISQDPGDSTIRKAYTDFVLDAAGYLNRSLAQRREAYRLAPADVVAVMDLAAGYSLMGRDTDATRYADLAVKLGYPPEVIPIPHIYGNAAIRSGRYREAADRIVVTLPASIRAAGADEVIRRVYVAIGDPQKRLAASAELQSFLGKLKEDDPDVNARKFVIQVFTQLDALDLAYQFANQSLDYLARTGTVGSAWGLLWLPEMRPFRRDPRFQGFATRLGLIPYWQQYGAPDGCDLKDGKVTCH
jgi:adenylate cyclase